MSLLVPGRGGAVVVATDMSGAEHEALEVAAVIAGPHGLLLEAVHQRWEGGGGCAVTSRLDGDPAFDRIVGRMRLGVQQVDDGTSFCELVLARWDDSNPFGNLRGAQMTDLDGIAGDSGAAALLIGAGAIDVGTRADVIGDVSRRRNRLCARFPSSSPDVPLTVLALTRAAALVRSLGSSS